MEPLQLSDADRGQIERVLAERGLGPAEALAAARYRLYDGALALLPGRMVFVRDRFGRWDLDGEWSYGEAREVVLEPHYGKGFEVRARVGYATEAFTQLEETDAQLVAARLDGRVVTAEPQPALEGEPDDAGLDTEAGASEPPPGPSWESEPVWESEPAATWEPESQAGPEAEPERSWEAEPEAAGEVEPEGEPELEAPVEPEGEPELELAAGVAEPEAEPQVTVEPEGEPEPAPEAPVEPEVEPATKLAPRRTPRSQREQAETKDAGEELRGLFRDAAAWRAKHGQPFTWPFVYQRAGIVAAVALAVHALGWNLPQQALSSPSVAPFLDWLAVAFVGGLVGLKDPAKTMQLLTWGLWACLARGVIHMLGASCCMLALSYPAGQLAGWCVLAVGAFRLSDSPRPLEQQLQIGAMAYLVFGLLPGWVGGGYAIPWAIEAAGFWGVVIAAQEWKDFPLKVPAAARA